MSFAIIERILQTEDLITECTRHESGQSEEGGGYAINTITGCLETNALYLV